MIHGTIAEIRGMKWFGCPYGVYLYRRQEGAEVLYVGQSLQPILRTRQHINASSKLAIGAILRENLPASLDWRVEIYSVPECDALVQKYANEHYQDYLRCQQEIGLIHNSARIAERALIACHKPLYNYPPGRRHK